MADLHILEPSDDEDHDQQTATRNRGKKSGRSKIVNDVIIRDIDWPHYHVYMGPNHAPATYEELSIPEFVYGYVCQLLDGKNNAKTKTIQLSYLRDIMREATDHPWANVRNFHGIVLSQMEMARLSWTDDDAIRNLRDTYVTRAPQLTAMHADSKGVNKRYCLMYQDGRCKQAASEHTSTRGAVHHICAFCYRATGNAYQHAEKDCIRKVKSSKNSDRPSA
jgi:hypothetical protein